MTVQDHFEENVMDENDNCLDFVSIGDVNIYCHENGYTVAKSWTQAVEMGLPDDSETELADAIAAIA
jgi:exonuclease III